MADKSHAEGIENQPWEGLVAEKMIVFTLPFPI